MAQELTDAEVFGPAAPPPTAEPAPAAAAPATPSGELSDAEVFGTPPPANARMNLAVQSASGKNPDHVARVMQLSTQTGMSADLIERNFDQVDKYARTQALNNLPTTSPALAKQLEDPTFAALSDDDLAKLSGLEYFIAGTKEGLRRDAGYISRASRTLLAGGSADLTTGEASIVEGIAKTIAPAFDWSAGTLFPENPFRRVAEGYEQARKGQQALANTIQGDVSKASFLEQSVLSGIRSVGQQAPGTLASIYTGNPNFALFTGGTMQGSQSISKALDAGLPPSQAMMYGVQDMVAEIVTEKLPLDILLKDLKVGAPFLKVLGHQVATEVPSEIAATAWQNFNEYANLHPDEPISTYLDSLPEAEAQTVISTLTATILTAGMGKGAHSLAARHQDRQAAAQTAEQTAAVMKQVTQLATESKLRERSPQAFQQFIDAAAKDGPVQDVYIDAATLNDTLHQSGVELPPSAAAQMAEALTTKSDVRIPLGEYAAKLAASPAGEKLLAHIKTSPEAMSQTEAKDFMQGQAEQFQAEATKVLEEKQFDTAWQQSAKTVENELLTQLNTANRFTPDVNSAYASLMGNFYSVQADRLGISPEEMYVKYPLRIQAESVVGGTKLDQGLAADAGIPYNKENPGTIGQEAAGIKARIETALAQSKVGTIEEADHAQIDRRQQDQPSVADIAAAPAGGDVSGLDAGVERAGVRRDQSRTEPSAAALQQALKDFSTQGLNAPAFQRFMQGAFFVTPDGAPVIFYHGSQNAGKTTFDESRLGGSTGAPESGLGFFITGSKTGANLYAKGKRNASQQGTRYETVTNVKNPYIVESLRDFKDAKTLDDFRQIRASLEAAGYDSIYSKSNRWVVAFHPEAIKSLRSTGIATGQTLRVARGTFGAEDSQVFYQGTSGNANRGSVSFGPDITKSPTIISLLQKADLSTFLHESGHFYLEVLSDIASQENAPPEIVQDMQKVLDWFGVKDLATWRGMSIDDKRVYHEQFARGFESYLFEGKAPSTTLAKVFARFRAWMTNVYRSLQALNVTLSDDVRGVMDRLLATSQQIQEADTARSYVPLFDTKPDGMTAAEWESYQNTNADATQEAVETLQKRSLRNMQWLQNARSGKLKQLQKAADQKRAAVHREVVAEVKAKPVYAVQDFMRKGDLPGFEGGKGVKLSLPAIRDMLEHGTPEQRIEIAKFTNEHADLLTETDGVHPDELAPMFGFTSGDHLIQAITDAEPEASVVAGMTDQRMLEKYGDLNSPQELARAANEAIHNEARGRFIAAEIQALNKATGQKKLLVKAAKEFADQIIARKKIRDVRPAQYEAAEARAARNADKAYKKGKGGLVEAATEKRNQLVNHYATRAAYDALDAVDKGLRYLGKFDSEGSRKGLDVDYLDQIDALLDRFDLRKGQSLKNIDKAKSLAEWITEQEEQGLTPIIPDELRNEAFHQHYKEMSVEAFQGLLDSVKNIEHLGRLKKKLLTAVDQREFETAVDEIRASIEDNAKKTIAERRMSDRGFLVDAGKLFRAFLAEHRKFASLAEELDGFKDGGAAWEYLARTMNAAGDFEASQNEKATIALEALFKPVFHKRALRTKTYFPTIGKSFTYEERLGIALNMGNEVNRERVLSGERLSPQQLETILDTLSEADWHLVQGVWDYLESFRPQIAAKERRVTGVEPKWVEASPVRTKFGELKGGYFPIKYDVLRSSRSESDTAAEVQRQTMQGLYTRAQTRRGHLKARSESTGRPLRYDLGVTFEHVSQVVHDLAWHEYLIDANRLLKAPALDESIRAHYGPEKLKAMKTTLESVAKGQVGPQTAFGSLMNHVRFGATISGLGWRLSTALLQPIGLTQSMSRIGVKWVAKGARHWLGDAVHLQNSVRLVGEKSEFMRLRAKTLQREINEIRNKVSGKDSKIQASYFYAIQKMQLVADMPTWWGQYEKSMAEPDMTESKAIALADQAVIDAQGGGQIKDLSNIERGQEGQKLFTVFYSFFNTTHNLTTRAFNRTDFTSPKSVALFTADMSLIYAIPAILGLILKQALRGDWWDDPEKALEDLIKQAPSELMGYVLGTLVGLREMSATARALTGQYSDYNGPASVRLFSEFQKLGQQAAQGEADSAFWKALNNVGGILFHYPAGQINQTLAGASDLIDGKTENPGVLLTGPHR